MQAIGYHHTGPSNAPGAFIAFTTAQPTLGVRDLLVEVRGISVNPVDTKVRSKVKPKQSPKILGYDAAGVVQAIGQDVQYFKVGDPVFYAGDLTRPGTNAALHAVDERIVGRKPESLGFAEAAGLPLTAITAWELLFDSFALTEGQGQGEQLLHYRGCRGCKLYPDSTGKKIDGLDRDSNRLAPRNGVLGPQNGRRSRD